MLNFKHSVKCDLLNVQYTSPILDIECKIVYVGSAESEEFDQVLDSVLVGPVPAGKHMFVFQVNLQYPIIGIIYLFF